MAIKGVVGRVAGISAKVQGQGNVRVKQVAVGNSSTSVNLSAKSINELQDVNAAESDDGFLQYNASNDKWETTTTIDGGTF
tara:strand:+ start:69 stop:311 length:243 start_codon:yes stop_codon:yes gene_type:complete